jgi:CRISPR-associated endonuclease/helicase Cas3
MGADVLGNNDWKAARNELLNELAQIVGLDVEVVAASKIEVSDPYLVPVLAGFVSVVDWIASNQDFFPCVAECGQRLETTADDYWATAHDQAVKALEALGWLPSVTFQQEAEFADVFKGFTPNGLQEKVIEIAKEQRSPYLMVVEAPMGQGKTEAALYAADLAMCRGFARGMYVAMPTQATSNAMFTRVLGDYLKGRGHSGKLNVQLVHGNALLTELANEAKIGEIKEFKSDSVHGDISQEDFMTADVEAQSWFTARKRPLLAPFGIGTIDQSLLSVLQTKHWFIRMFGLDGKVVVFDEVHAYDAYMSTILERLLHWLAELDCTVILLSATLPDARRKALAKAYSGRDDAEYQRYPRITFAQPRHFLDKEKREQPKGFELEMEAGRTVKLTVQGTDLTELSNMVANKLANGGCAAVICNTVDRSIEVFRHLQQSMQDTECLLFHARTLKMWRREREEEVLKKFGKREPQGKDADGNFINQDRPKRAVLVATQVVEQSLDLDFDLMVSEIAPIDLLLQRSGRLHRHQRVRPWTLERPELIVLCDGEKAGPPPETFGKYIERVYDRYILLRSWLAIRERSQIGVPSEIEQLIEFVYSGDEAPANDGWPQALAEAQAAMEFERSESEKKACRLLVSKPKDPSDLVEQFNDQLADDEDPTVHKDVRAATREGEPSITVVMVPQGEVLTNEPEIPEVKKLLDRSVKISKRGLFQELVNGVQPTEWAKNAHLRHARCVRLDAQSQAIVGAYTMTVDEKLGVVIDKSGGE